MGLEDKISELTGYAEEQEWFEFKENWFQPDELGEYVSAISNSAAFHYQEMGYFVWGVKDDTHEIVGTSFDPYLEYHKEPYQNYLARNLSPSLNFSFRELEVKGKRVVILLIPPAEEIPTSFKDVRYIRIGSSKVNLKKYPKREVQLFRILSGREETIVNKASEYQDLTFHKLFGYYGSKGIVLKERTFVKNLKLKTASGEYNLLAQLLSMIPMFRFGFPSFKERPKPPRFYPSGNSATTAFFTPWTGFFSTERSSTSFRRMKKTGLWKERMSLFLTRLRSEKP